MLHLIFQSTVDSALLQRIDSGGDVVFLENAVFRVIKQGLSSVELQSLLKNRVYLYVLDIELETRGINAAELVSGIEIIDYPGLVGLTEKNRVICTWS
jgi:tRNA 2-thiouridine synthesizing protein B